MPRYVVKSPLEHDGKPYAPGEFVVLSEAQAAVMPWAVEAAPETKKAEPPKSTK